MFTELALAILRILVSIVLLSIVANIAMPKAPAIFLARANTEDAMPISFSGTDDATMLVLCDIPKPMPKAIIDIGSMISIAVDLGSM